MLECDSDQVCVNEGIIHDSGIVSRIECSRQGKSTGIGKPAMFRTRMERCLTMSRG